MGEVIGAAAELRARGLPPGAFHALIAIAEKAHTDTRQGSVRWDHIRSAMYSSNSLRSAERAVKALKDAGLIRVVQRGFNNQAGTVRAPIYEVCALPVSATQSGGFGPSVSATQGGGFSERANPPNPGANPPKSGGEPATLGVGLDGLFDGSIDGGTRAAEPRPSAPANSAPTTPPTAEPSRYCRRHPNGTDDPCGSCGEARLRHADWTKMRNTETELQQQESRNWIAKLRARCTDCDANGLVDTGGDTVIKCRPLEDLAPKCRARLGVAS